MVVVYENNKIVLYQFLVYQSLKDHLGLHLHVILLKSRKGKAAKILITFHVRNRICH